MSNTEVGPDASESEHGHASARRPVLVLEMWFENRPFIKAVLVDFGFFLLFVAILELSHLILKSLSLQGEQVATLEEWHFRLIVAAWLLLAFGMLGEIVILLVRRIREISREPGEHSP